ncbi:MAG: class I SAM-dependent methyltransferase [Microgenomates group bacterium]
MIQSQEELESWYQKDDPWDYEDSFDDIKRRDILLAELPKRPYKNVLDIGCGHGFVTRELPGEKVIGLDMSERAVRHANLDAKNNPKLSYVAGDLYKITELFQRKTFDLIIITGVLYPQYIGNSKNLIYHLIDTCLDKSGILMCVHISDWYKSRFPYIQLEKYIYDYRTYSHIMEIYQK